MDHSPDATPPPRAPAHPLRAWERYVALTQLGFPARYPLAQVPNLPLTVGLLASFLGWFVSGSAHSYAAAAGTIGIAVWAWGEALQGLNLFRHALGLAVLASTLITLADRLG